MMQTEKTYRLSPQQAHLWDLQKSAGTMPFRAQCLISVTGELDRKHLKEAVGIAVRRHEILRTSFVGSGAPDETLQMVHNDERFVLDEMLLQGMPPDEQQQGIAGLWNNSLHLPLIPGELSLRATLIALSSLKHALLVSLSALCADLATLENLAREIARIYAACSHGESSSGPMMQYGDLAAWQNELLGAQDDAVQDDEAQDDEAQDDEAQRDEAQDKALRIGREYWSRFNLGGLSVHKLPFQTEISSPAEFVVREFTSRLPLDQVLRVRQAARKTGKSVGSFVLVCWGVMLSRSIGEPEITVGVSCDGRKYEELKIVVGPLTKFLPLTLSCPAGASFISVLTSVEQSLADSHQWQECFDWRHSKPESAIFPFSFEYVPEFRRWDAGDVSFRIEKHWACGDCFRIRLSCLEQDGGLVMRIHYDGHSFQAEEVRLLGERLHTILECAAGNPEALVADLQLLGPVERRKVLVEFSAIARRPMSDLNIHQMFEQQVGRTPDSLAIVTGQGCLTYRDLNRRANQLAHYLRRRGIVAESRVAILMERSLEMFIAVLAVLKAGAAYVPVDSQYPAERISFVLADAAPAVLLTRSHWMEKLPGSSVNAICMDAVEEAIALEGEADVAVPLSPECLVYLIYTSGSTGRPKGSMVSHRAVMNHAMQMIDLYGLGPGRRMLQFFPLSFDASAEDIFPSLLSGATLVCPPDSLAYSSAELLAFSGRYEVTTLHLPVVLWHRLVEELSTRNLSLPPRIRTLSVGGESPSAGSLAVWSRVTGGRVAFRNMYGPTEAAITATVYRQDEPAERLESRFRVPIGHPLANVSIHLLDAAMEVVPVGMPGEIHIGGVALARGYVNLPDLTADRFVPDPFSEHPGARLYKTGDLGRFLINGEIEFLGRADHQVKIRGFRIELHEIERILARYPAIKDTVVTVHENGTLDKRLAAYVTLKPNQSATARQMRRYLRNHVPDYMLPSWFVVLNSLPLNSSGKIDRNALPPPANESLGTAQEYVAPRSSAEKVIAAAFAEVLRINQVGILDNFFESGGHSLLAIQLVSRLQELFQVEVPLRRIFDDPTVAGIAAALLEEEGERLQVERAAEFLVKSAAASDDEAGR